MVAPLEPSVILFVPCIIRQLCLEQSDVSCTSIAPVFHTVCWIGTFRPGVIVQVDSLRNRRFDSKLMLVASAVIDLSTELGATICSQISVIVFHQIVGLLQVRCVVGNAGHCNLLVESDVVNEEDAIVFVDVFNL